MDYVSRSDAGGGRVLLRNLEAGNYPVAFLQLRDLMADFIDNPHPCERVSGSIVRQTRL